MNAAFPETAVHRMIIQQALAARRTQSDNHRNPFTHTEPDMIKRLPHRACPALVLILLCIVVACGKKESRSTEDAPVVAKEPLTEMKVLDQRIGTWKAVLSAKPAVWTPDGLELSGDEKIESILKGRFIQGKTVNSDKSEATWLATYDENQKAYRFWFFNSFGAATQSAGQWDEKTKTITWSDTNEMGVTSVAHWRFVDADTLDWDLLAKDKDGKVYLDMKGKVTRQK